MNTPLIDAKLHPPVHGNLLYRERLLDQLSQNASKKVFLIDGCAGSGKTVLALQFLNTLGLEPAWISLDHHDRDPALFFAYLTTAIRSLCPGFGQELGFRTVTSVETWASFLHALQNRIEKPLYIVLDNFECINGAAEVNEFLSYLIQHLPYSVHIVFLCSQTPRFSLRNYGLSNGLCHLKASDLAFTFDEAIRLFEEGFGVSMAPSMARSILDETEGWTLALVLMGQHMRGREAARKNRKIATLQKHYEAIHEYFLEDVLKPLPGRIEGLMVSSALLPFLSPNELRLYLGSESAEALLRHFRGSNVPIFPLSAGSETFRYHKMFRRFLLEKAHEQKSDADLTRLHRQAGLCLKKNYPVEAIDHYLSAGDVAEAMAVLEKMGSDLLRQGRYDTLKMLVNKIPLENRSNNPVLLYYVGRIQELHGDVDGAQKCYQGALEGLDEDAQDTRAACKTRLGILECKRDHFRQASRIFTSTLSRLKKSDIRQDIGKRLISTHSNLAKVYCKLEETRKAAEHIKEAQSAFDLFGKPEDEVVLLQARTLDCVVKGRFPDALLLGEKGKALCQELGFRGAIPIFNHYVAFAHAYTGDFQQARNLAAEGLAVLKEQGVEDCIHGALLAVLGQCDLAEGRVQEGVRTLQESTALFKKSFNFCGQFWNEFNLCMLLTRQGNLSEAWECWRSMERNSRQLALPLQQAMTLIVEALLSAMEQAPEKTTGNLSKAKALLKGSQQRMSVFHGHILALKAYETIGRRDLAEETFLESISPDDPKHYYAAIHFELHWFLPFVERVMQKSPQQRPIWDDVTHRLSPHRATKIGNAPPGVTAPKPRSPVWDVDLHFYVLGPFRVTANGWPVPLETCASKRALTLLRYLFFKRHEGGVLLDEAMELLWPEIDPSTSRSYLRVALSMLRKVFKSQGQTSEGFPNLSRDGNKLMLSLGKKGGSDVDELMSQVKLAGYKEKKGLWPEALKHYEKVLELYRGDFLLEELYADWCAMEREYLKDQYTTSLMRMVRCHEEMGNIADAISSVYRVLKTDKYREDAYQELMALCARSGRKGEMARAYTLCKKAIEEDLNMELSSDTTALYARFCRQISYQRERTGPMISLVQ